MNPEEYDKMYNQENTYWWFQGRKKIIFRMIKHYNLLNHGKARVLDIGCGTGLILEALAEQGFAMGLDFSFKALQFSRQRNLKNLIRGNVKNIPVKDSSVDLVVALDLLEHIEDDQGLLDEIQRVLKPGGYLLSTVPAHQSLWSEHDEALHHFRRYSKPKFSDMVKKHNFSLVKYSYVISFTYFPIYIFRWGQRIYRKIVPTKQSPKTHIIILPEIINSLLIRILEFEGRLLQRMNLPFGVSLLCIAEKRKMRNTPNKF